MERIRSLLRRVPGSTWTARRVRRSLTWTSYHARRSLKSSIYNEPFVHLAESYLRRYYSYDTQRLWGGADPPPEWFDHRADLYRFSELRVPFWVERGVFSREVMFQGCRVLDLCCGDGFYAYHFYSGSASHIDAVDLDPMAIAHARKWHSHPKIKYAQLNVANDMFPGAEYDVITWDAAIEHFQTDQIRTILGKCASALKDTTGVLCGYTIIARSSDKSHPEHKHEFVSAAELKDLLLTSFPFVGTIQTEYAERHNIYFRAAFRSDRLRRF